MCLMCMRLHMMCVLCSQTAPFMFIILAPQPEGKDTHWGAESTLRSAVARSHDIDCTAQQVRRSKG